jgi:hypothetical protein
MPRIIPDENRPDLIATVLRHEYLTDKFTEELTDRVNAVAAEREFSLTNPFTPAEVKAVLADIVVEGRTQKLKVFCNVFDKYWVYRGIATSDEIAATYWRLSTPAEIEADRVAADAAHTVE